MALRRWTFGSLGGPTTIPDAQVQENLQVQAANRAAQAQQYAQQIQSQQVASIN